MFLKAWTTDWCQSKNFVVQWDLVHDEITIRLSFLSTQGRKVGPWPRMTRDVETQAFGTKMSMSEAAAAASGSDSFLAFSHWEFPLLPCLFCYLVKKMWIILSAHWGCYSVRIFSLGFHVRNGSLSQGTFIIRKNINIFKRNKGTHLYRGLVFPSPRWKSSLSGPNPVVLVPQPVYPSPY